MQHIATHCDTLQHTLNTLQYTSTHSNTLQHTPTHCKTLQHSATHCNTLQHIATRYTHSNTLHYTPCSFEKRPVMTIVNLDFHSDDNFEFHLFRVARCVSHTQKNRVVTTRSVTPSTQSNSFHQIYSRIWHAFSLSLRKLHSVNPFDSNFCKAGRAGWLRKRWNFRLTLSAKRTAFYFLPNSTRSRTHSGAMHDERAKWTSSYHGLRSKTWNPPEWRWKLCEFQQKGCQFRNKFDWVKGVEVTFACGILKFSKISHWNGYGMTRAAAVTWYASLPPDRRLAERACTSEP